jgi:hypothetical protein
VPAISRFFGIVIRMCFDDHAPPHFHAFYGEHGATVRINPVGVIAGALPARALGLVVEWARIHERALLANWELARESRPLDSIPPLE